LVLNAQIRTRNRRWLQSGGLALLLASKDRGIKSLFSKPKCKRTLITFTLNVRSRFVHCHKILMSPESSESIVTISLQQVSTIMIINMIDSDRSQHRQMETKLLMMNPGFKAKTHFYLLVSWSHLVLWGTECNL